MNNLEGFMKDTASYAGVFTAPVCSELEGNYANLFSESRRNSIGVYTINNTNTVARLIETEITGIGSWIRGGPTKIQGNVLVKNPLRTPENVSQFGVTNAILLDQDSGVVFAGRFGADYVTVLRPVIPAYQDIFREELQQSMDEMPAIAS